MADLPFLFVYGSWIWKALVVLSVAGGFVLPWRVRRRRARKNAARARQALGAPTTDLETRTAGDAVVIAGALSTTSDPVPGFLTSADVLAQSAWSFSSAAHVASQSAEKLAITVGDERVLLSAPIQVRAGSVEELPRAKAVGLPEKTQARLEAARDGAPLLGGPLRFESLVAGDTVWAAGTLARRPRAAGETEAGYRDDAGGFALVPHDDDEAIGMVTTTHPRVRSSFRLVPVFSAVGCGALMLGVLAIIGVIALEANEGSPAIFGTGRQIAAATPFHREDALELASYDLGRAVRRGRADAEQLFALAQVDGRMDCSPAKTLASVERFDLAGRALDNCPYPYAHQRVAESLAAAGRFSEASARIKVAAALGGAEHLSWRRAIAHHLLAGDLDTAAQAAERATFGCVAAALWARGGHEGGIDRLRTLANRASGTERDVLCTLLLADGLSGDARLDTMRNQPDWGHLSETQIARLLWYEAGGRCSDEATAGEAICDFGLRLIANARHVAFDLVFLHRPYSSSEAWRPALSLGAAQSLAALTDPSPREQRDLAILWARIALFHALTHAEKAAVENIDRAIAAAQKAPMQRSLQYWKVAILARLGRLGPARAVLAKLPTSPERTALARTIDFLDPQVRLPPATRRWFAKRFADAFHSSRNEHAIEQALTTGDVTHLQSVDSVRFPQMAAALAPRLTSHKHTLGSWLEDNYRSRTPRCIGSWEECALDASAFAAAFKAAGQSDRAAAKREVVARFREAFLRRDIAVIEPTLTRAAVARH